MWPNAAQGAYVGATNGEADGDWLLGAAEFDADGAAECWWALPDRRPPTEPVDIRNPPADRRSRVLRADGMYEYHSMACRKHVAYFLVAHGETRTPTGGAPFISSSITFVVFAFL